MSIYRTPASRIVRAKRWRLPSDAKLAAAAANLCVASIICWVLGWDVLTYTFGGLSGLASLVGILIDPLKRQADAS